MSEPVTPVPIKVGQVLLPEGIPMRRLQMRINQISLYLNDLRDEVTELRQSNIAMEASIAAWKLATGHESPESFAAMRDEMLTNGMFSEILEAAPAPTDLDQIPDPYLEYGLFP